ncbi:MAG: sulfotransferase family protein [Gammaproteobacteria bacterium]|nr:sulfotransferase family protein [Gammaproteobacteria bacterium]
MINTKMTDQELSLLTPEQYLETLWQEHKNFKKNAFEFCQQMRKTLVNDKYTYQPFDETQSIFIHIPKCAGVSISKALYGNLAGGHTTLEEYLVTFEPRNVLNYFKFTIVRNPWDRLVSAYFFLKQGGFGKEDKEWFDSELVQYRDFEDFVINWVNKINIWKWNHFKPQYHYMQDKRNKIQLNFIGLFENIEDDFSFISNHLGLKECELYFSNESSHSNYMDYYNETTKSIVAKVYEKDIHLLGYQFDNASLPEQIAKRSGR